VPGRSNIEPPGLGRIARTFARVLRFRCPNCGRGRLRAGGFRMRHRCTECGVVYERAIGEFSGGMGLNTLATCFGVAALALWVGMSDLSAWAAGLLVTAFAVTFPIAFYLHSRAVWIGILYLAHLVHGDERADAEIVIKPWS
jgi:uncharacterized protein (DUF983 family)